MRLLSLLPLLLLAAACAWAATPARNDPASYRAWRCVTPRPLRLPDPTAALCRIPQPSEVSPHRQSYFRVYVNPTGAKRLAGGGKGDYPAGTVIVKEKLPAPGGRKPELLTVMRKLPAARGRRGLAAWEFGVLDGAGRPVATEAPFHGVEMPRSMAHCRSCHEQAASKDYVFATYLPTAPAPRR